MTLIAKPIVKNQLWVLINGNDKVGNVQADKDGYQVRVGNKFAHFDTTGSIERAVKIEFQRPVKTASKAHIPYAVWPTSGRTYNNMMDVKRKLHLFTKNSKSKCYYAAGWFKMKLDTEWQTIFCPKYIFICRYEYSGPFITEEEANNHK